MIINNDNFMNVLKKNKLPVICNLRHLRKYLKIKKREQNSFFGKNRNELYDTFPLIKKLAVLE